MFKFWKCSCLSLPPSHRFMSSWPTSMVMASAAMPRETTPPSPLRSPAPSLHSPYPGAPSLHSPYSSAPSPRSLPPPPRSLPPEQRDHASGGDFEQDPVAVGSEVFRSSKKKRMKVIPFPPFIFSKISSLKDVHCLSVEMYCVLPSYWRKNPI